MRHEGVQLTFINACFDGDQKLAKALLEPLGTYERDLEKQPVLSPVGTPMDLTLPVERAVNHRSITYFLSWMGRVLTRGIYPHHFGPRSKSHLLYAA
jgi:hypothetical protein